MCLLLPLPSSCKMYHSIVWDNVKKLKLYFDYFSNIYLWNSDSIVYLLLFVDDVGLQPYPVLATSWGFLWEY